MDDVVSDAHLDGSPLIDCRALGNDNATLGGGRAVGTPGDLIPCHGDVVTSVGANTRAGAVVDIVVSEENVMNASGGNSLSSVTILSWHIGAVRQGLLYSDLSTGTFDFETGDLNIAGPYRNSTGTIEFNLGTGAWVIGNNDGSVEFSPKATPERYCITGVVLALAEIAVVVFAIHHLDNISSLPRFGGVLDGLEWSVGG